jgi:hypothetical protein
MFGKLIGSLFWIGLIVAIGGEAAQHFWNGEPWGAATLFVVGIAFFIFGLPYAAPRVRKWWASLPKAERPAWLRECKEEAPNDPAAQDHG